MKFSVHLFTRRHYATSHVSQRGLGLGELALMVVVVGVIFIGGWRWAMGTLDDLKITATARMVHDLADSVRIIDIKGNEAKRDNLAYTNLQFPSDIQKITKEQNADGHPGLFNLWKGNVWAYYGNAAFWGKLDADKEMTFLLENVPEDACVDLVRTVVSMNDIKPLAVFVAHHIGAGDEMCLAYDTACREIIVPDLARIKKACDQGSHVLVAFTYAR